MSAREKFENHPVPFGLGLIVVGFVAGFGAREALGRHSESVLEPAGQPCQVEGLDSLEQNHGARLATLNAGLVAFETKASDDSLISVYQEKYRQSADRVRGDIAAENESYAAALKSLTAACR